MTQELDIRFRRPESYVCSVRLNQAESEALTAAVPGLAIPTVGKPRPDLLQLALARAGVAPADAVFIGDTPETDGAAARAAGVEFVLLRRPGTLSGTPPEAQPC